MIVCTTINDEGFLEVFSRASRLVLVDTNTGVIYEEPNPALGSVERRPTVVRRCIELGAHVVVAPHGSICYPSYRVLKARGVKAYSVDRGISLGQLLSRKVALREVNLGEVAYSTIMAALERVVGH